MMQIVNILTPREKECLALVAMGFKNKQIGSLLFVSGNTVKKILENVYRKLYVKNRANAVAIAFIQEILNAKIMYQVSVNFKGRIDELKLKSDCPTEISRYAEYVSTEQNLVTSDNSDPY